ncbi:MAG: histidine kinase [Thermoanaerobaculaceae bacterium]|nr:histidine kinase [Thermoanaerobaculaceae bacterium]
MRRPRNGSGAAAPTGGLAGALTLAIVVLAGAAAAHAQEPPVAAPGGRGPGRVLELATDAVGTPLCAFAHDHSELLLDPGGALTIEDVTREDIARRFAPNLTRERPLVLAGGAVWVRVRLRSNLPSGHTYWLSVGRWGTVDCYVQRAGGERTVARSGAFVPVPERSAQEANVNRYIIKVPVPAGPNEMTVHLRLAGNVSLDTRPVSPAFHAVLHPDDARRSRTEVFVAGLTIGVLFALGLYHLILFVLVRERVYLFFSLALLGRAWLFGVGYRLLLEFVWPGAAHLDYYLAWFGIPLWVCAFFMFFMEFLRTRSRMPRVHRLLWVVMLLSLLSPLLHWQHAPWLPTMEGVFRLAWASTPVVVAAFELRRRSREALIFLLANVLMLIYFLAYALDMLGLNVLRLLPPDGFYLGILLSAVLFSIAVAEQMRGLRAEKEQAERDEAAAEELLHRQELDRARLAAELSEARFQVLKNQLQPHFLFNTLDSISALMRVDVAQAESKLALLADLLRTTLDERNANEVRLGDEVSFVKRYLDIETTRLAGRLAVVWEIAPDTLVALVPHLILQPLVENAVRHGIGPRSRGGTILVRAWREGESLHVQVRDDGVGLRGRHAVHEGLGLSNTRERLHHLYGEAAGCEAGEAEGGGFEVTVRVPFHAAEASEVAVGPIPGIEH